MSSKKLFIQDFRANDLKDHSGSQIEFGKAWLDFLEIEDSQDEVNIPLIFKALNLDYQKFDNKEIELNLGEVTSRGDRKTYAKGSSSGHSALKEFFLNDLHLTQQKNSEDYFAIYKDSELSYYLYYIPKLLYDNFIKLFESISPTVTIHRASKRSDENTKSLQKIFYGAPGTGKSNKIKEEVDDQGKIHYRTTFHPDSDYSTFVGCYKPISHKKNMLAGNGINEIQLLSYFFNSNGDDYKGKNKARYLYEALVHTQDIRSLGLDAKSLAEKLKAKGFDSCAYTVEANCMYNIYDWLKEDGYIVENKLSYEFIPQTFTKAYVDAWKNQKSGTPVYLIIEEINRGNCAQIFGDLFQLLDRDDEGYSRYEVSPDSDLEDYIATLGLDISGIKNSKGEDISSQIANGKLLKLPNNMYIWATMNTSDQSLFPIDSAFKRRWDWEYIPIDTKKEEWNINVGGSLYSWTVFLEKINNEILTDETAEDKHLGFYFCKADDNEINAVKFVGKVLFYLWNDVFKVYGIPATIGSSKDWSYTKFYNTDGTVDEQKVKDLMKKLEIPDLVQKADITKEQGIE